MQNPTAIGLSNVTVDPADLTMTNSAFMISLCLYVTLPTAFRSLSGSAMRRMFTLCLTSSMVSSGVGLQFCKVGLEIGRGVSTLLVTQVDPRF